jgi:hypothetical protein
LKLVRLESHKVSETGPRQKLSRNEQHAFDILASHLGHIIEPTVSSLATFPPLHQTFFKHVLAKTNYVDKKTESGKHLVPVTFHFSPSSPFSSLALTLPNPLRNFSSEETENQNTHLETSKHLKLCVPVGNSAHEGIVSNGTLAITLIASVYIISVCLQYKAGHDLGKRKRKRPTIK